MEIVRSAREAHELFAAQRGLASRDQLLALGYSARRIRHRVECSRREVILPLVYGIAGHRPSWNRRLWAAFLHAGPGSVVPHESAGRLERLRQVPAGRVVLIVPGRRRHPPPGVRWVRAEDLAEEDVTVGDGLPRTTLARTVVDLASVTHVASLRLLVEECVVERRLCLAQVGATLERVRRQGKPGVRRLSDVLDDLGPGDGVPRSELELLLDRVIVASGLPDPVHEYPLPGVGAMCGSVDRCWPDVRLIVEGDGRKWHTRRQQALADASPTLQAQASGFEVVRLLWEHPDCDAAGTAARLRQIHEL